MIPDPGSHQRVTLSLESIYPIRFQSRASDVKIPKLRQLSANCRMPCFVNIFGTCRGIWNESDQNPDALFRSLVDIFSNMTNRDIQWPGMLIARNIDHVSCIGCTYDWNNRRSGMKLILFIPPPVTGIYFAVDSTMLSQQDAPVQNRGVPEMGDVLVGTECN